MHLRFLTPFVLTASLLLNGCGGGGSSTPTTTSTTNLTLSVDRNITINNAVQIEPLGTASISVDVNITNGPRDLYVLLSNYSTTTDSLPQITHTPKILASSTQKNLVATVPNPSTYIIHAPQEVEDFRKNTQQLMHKKSPSTSEKAKVLSLPIVKQADIVGDINNFQINLNSGVTTAATARKVVSNVVTNLGTRTLNIWVSDDSFDSGSGCIKANCVTQAMVDVFATKFLTTGLDNDIYDWVSNIYGSEWGADAQTLFTKLIPFDGNITIFLTDIDNDNSTTGGVVGYYYPKDNFLASSVSGSNERIMFYIDSVLLATPDTTGSWTINDFWPQQMISTLAHEFQHMIHFYQKDVRFNTTSATWLNEMLSEATEDVVATKLQNSGTRNVVYTDGSAGPTGNIGGRYPRFNTYNTLSLTSWNSLLADYSKVNAFGTFLTRNYGAQVLHDIVVNNFTSTDAVASATGKPFNTLLTEWGEAVLLSDQTTLLGIPTYNTGAFTVDTYNAITYQLGSINFFNYSPSVTINTGVGTVNPQGNYYYKVGTALSGLVHIEVLLNGSTEATLIAK